MRSPGRLPSYRWPGNKLSVVPPMSRLLTEGRGTVAAVSRLFFNPATVGNNVHRPRNHFQDQLGCFPSTVLIGQTGNLVRNIPPIYNHFRCFGADISDFNFSKQFVLTSLSFGYAVFKVLFVVYRTIISLYRSIVKSLFVVSENFC